MLLLTITVLVEGETPKRDFVIHQFPENRRYYWGDIKISYAEPKFGKETTIYFDFDSDRLRKDQIPKLKIFKKGDRVVISGYASPEGSERYNLNLSKRRALSVKRFLEKRGVKVENIKVFGESLCFEEPKNWWKCRKAEVEER